MASVPKCQVPTAWDPSKMARKNYPKLSRGNNGSQFPDTSLQMCKSIPCHKCWAEFSGEAATTHFYGRLFVFRARTRAKNAKKSTSDKLVFPDLRHCRSWKRRPSTRLRNVGRRSTFSQPVTWQVDQKKQKNQQRRGQSRNALTSCLWCGWHHVDMVTCYRLHQWQLLRHTVSVSGVDRCGAWIAVGRVVKM
jgi:hypothetical protein